MLYIPMIDNYLKTLTDNEMKDFVAIHFREYPKSARKKLYSKLKEEQDLWKGAESLYTFLTTPDEVKKYVEIMQETSSDNCVHHYNFEMLNIFDPKLQPINAKTMIENKFKDMFSGLKNFKVLIILVLDYKKRNNGKIFYSK